jgi:type I restriction enzyme S subunit
MAYKQVSLGDYFKFEKGLGYKGEFLAEDSDVALIGMDSHEEGGGYKEGSEKPYSGPYKEIHVSNPGDVIFAATDLTQDGHVLGSPLLVPDSDEFQTFIYSHHLLKAFQIKEGFLPEYLYNIYRCEKYRLKAAYADSGTTVRALPSDVLEEQIVPLPDLSIQIAINEIISLIDQQIANNKSLAKNLELLAQSIFKSWFIDFDPVHAKSRGEKPFGMDDETAALFPDSFEESELGMIPNGWNVRSIGDSVVKQKVGKLFDSKTSFTKGAVPVLDQGKSGVVGYHNEEPGVFASPDKPLVVFANHTCSLRLISYPFSVIQNVFPLIGKNVDVMWLYFAVEGKQMFDSYKGHWPDFVLHKIIHPAEEMTRIFRSKVEPILQQKWLLEAESVSLANLRDVLLPKLISGELQIPEEMLVS